MTDIDELVAGLHTDVPKMRDSAFEAGRARLQAFVDPRPMTAPRPDPAVIPLPLPKRRLLRSPPRSIAAAAAVVALVAGALLIPFGDSPPTATAVAESLNAAARKVESQPDQPVAPGQYRYVQVRERYLHEAGPADDVLTYYREMAYETWVPADWNAEWLHRRTEGEEIQWVDGSDERAKELGIILPEPFHEELRSRCGNFWAPEPCQSSVTMANPTPEFLAGLPTEPQELYNALESASYSTNPQQLLESIGYLLSTGVVPADIRANIYEALAFLPGLTITDNRANLDGRIGVAYGVTAWRWQTDLIIDPTTGEYLGSRQVLAEDMRAIGGGGKLDTTATTSSPGSPSEMHRKGTVFSYSAVSTAVVNQIGKKPAN